IYSAAYVGWDWKGTPEMRRRFIVGCLLAAVLPAFGQEKAAKKAGSVEEMLMKMERDWVDASLKNDVKSMDTIMADDWVGTNYLGTFTKAQVLGDMKAGQVSSTSIQLGEMKVRVYGDTAVVTGSDTEKSSYKGKDTSGKYTWTDIFVRRNGRWQAVASQST